MPIGWNRERAERSAGLRTFPLVAIASCGLVQAVEGTMSHDPSALARVLEGVIAGIGFLGGGAILQQRHSVKGTATAASSYDVGLVLTVFTLLTFWIMAPLKPDANERDEDEPASERGSAR